MTNKERAHLLLNVALYKSEPDGVRFPTEQQFNDTLDAITAALDEKDVEMTDNATIVAAEWDEGMTVSLQRTQCATFKSRQQAVDAATLEYQDLPWDKIFCALEAAGIVAFLDQETEIYHQDQKR